MNSSPATARRESVVGSIRILGDAVFTGMDVGDGVALHHRHCSSWMRRPGCSASRTRRARSAASSSSTPPRSMSPAATILDQLADDPQYDGYQDDLNAPAAVQRPDGVIRADSIEIEFGDGGKASSTRCTSRTPARRTCRPASWSATSLFGEDNEVDAAAGIDRPGHQWPDRHRRRHADRHRGARRAGRGGGDITPFTDNSTINGCLLTGPCGVVEPPEPPFPPGFTPTPGIQDEVTLIDDDLLPPPHVRQ